MTIAVSIFSVSEEYYLLLHNKIMEYICKTTNYFTELYTELYMLCNICIRYNCDFPSCTKLLSNVYIQNL